MLCCCYALLIEVFSIRLDLEAAVARCRQELQQLEVCCSMIPLTFDLHSLIFRFGFNCFRFQVWVGFTENLNRSPIDDRLFSQSLLDAFTSSCCPSGSQMPLSPSLSRAAAATASAGAATAALPFTSAHLQVRCQFGLAFGMSVWYVSLQLVSSD